MKINVPFKLCIVGLFVAGCREAPRTVQAPPDVHEFIWEEECILPPNKPQFRQFTHEYIPMIELQLEQDLAKISEANPGLLGDTKLYFTLDAHLLNAGQVLIISTKPLSERSRAALAPLGTEARTMYLEANGMAP